MRLNRIRTSLTLAAIAAPVLVMTQTRSDALGVSARAREVHTRAIVVDSHDDTTQRMLYDKTFDLGARHADGNIDIPRMREGGLDALFFSIWVAERRRRAAGGEARTRPHRRRSSGGPRASERPDARDDRRRHPARRRRAQRSPRSWGWRAAT